MQPHLCVPDFNSPTKQIQWLGYDAEYIYDQSKI